MGAHAAIALGERFDVARAPTLVLTILIPCLNEAETLGTCIAKAWTYLDRSGLHGEVLVADNGSTDGSQTIASSLGARVVSVPVRGYGAALATGIAVADGRFVIMGDGDDSYDFSELSAFVTALEGGADLVMGNRFKGGIAAGAMPLLHRYLGNPVLSALGRLLFRTPVRDFHCGLRGFRRDAILRLGLRTTGMEFASEMVVQAALSNLAIAEVPTGLKPDGRSRPPHLRTWRDGWRHLRFMLLHSPRWTLCYPGLVSLAFGAVLTAALLPGRLTLGASFSLDIRAFLVGCLAMLVGVQSVTFGVIARRFAGRNALLPTRRKLHWSIDAITLERMLQGAAATGLLGIGGLVAAVGIWGHQHFGDLASGQMLRLVVLSVTAIVAAVQLGSSAFLMGIMDLAEGGDDARARLQRLRTNFPDA